MGSVEGMVMSVVLRLVRKWSNLGQGEGRTSVSSSVICRGGVEVCVCACVCVYESEGVSV